MSGTVTYRASRTRPCPVCGSGTKGRSATGDGLHFCRGESRPGWRLMKLEAGDAGFYSYRRADDAHRGNGDHRPPTPPKTDWPAEARRYAANLTDALRGELAAALGLPVEALTALPLIGWNPDDPFGPCWTFPETDDAGRVIGINRRYRDGSKRVMQGGHRGLTIPVGWRDRPGPLHLVEGASDVIATSLCGLAAIGRPSNTGGLDYLAELLRDLPGDRPVIVAGENDRKPEGQWPGREGAVQTAAKLGARLGRELGVAFPPDGVKDVRAWVAALAADYGEAVDWAAVGRAVLKGVVRFGRAAAADPFAEAVDVSDLLTMDLPEPKFVVGGIIPTGLVVLAAKPKLGKSWLIYQVALAIASGRQCLGNAATERRPVLYLALEDTRRRLKDRAAKMIEGLGWKSMPKGLTVHTTFPRASKGGMAGLSEWFADHPGGVVIIDTLQKFRDRPKNGGSYDEDYETCGQLKQLADAHGGTVIVVHHTRKNPADDPFDEVSGTLGITGSADTTLVIDRDRSEPAGALYLTGRDIAERTLQLSWDAAHGLWAIAGDGEDGIRRPDDPKRQSGSDKCAAWLEQLMAGYTWPDADLEKAAKLHDYSTKQYRTAKEKLRGRDEGPWLQSFSEGYGPDKRWWHFLGEKGRPPPKRPDDPPG